MGGGGGGGSGPTVQQQQLETQQALAEARLNLEENAQRKTILNAMQGMRVFRGSALSRAVAGNTAGGGPAPGPSPTQNRSGTGLIGRLTSLLDLGTGSTPAGGAGASGAGRSGGSYAGGGSSGGGRAGPRGTNIA